MVNNDILRRLTTIFTLSDTQVSSIFKLGQYDFSVEQLTFLFKEKDDAAYVQLTDVELASFLNGFIIEKRGAKDGPLHQAETELTNNLIFNKIKIALALKAEDVLAVLDSAKCSLTKYELSAFFRNVNNKHYKDCSDLVLNAFLNGLKEKYLTA